MTITDHDQFCAATEEERAVWLAITLGIIYRIDERPNTGAVYWWKDINDIEACQNEEEIGDDMNHWLSSTDGREAIDNAMIKRGYSIDISYGYGDCDLKEKEWFYCFTKTDFSAHWMGDKSDAQQHAAAKALFSEVREIKTYGE